MLETEGVMDPRGSICGRQSPSSRRWEPQADLNGEGRNGRTIMRKLGGTVKKTRICMSSISKVQINRWH